ncbi:hypothetical protein K469DRAFT_688089 [Zopfia rhizophila CBS 207.26]|uniref:Uncharacterized protein n=1 Tax=Zopfia rhizophila CBS 207.26 TaxID=1314779 RepID=A0A6A6E024_9PEZI|nr:hypothetical protein K469DRAFT_688089 [Zopfia rhizophila CBS 207.26]
MPTTKLRILVYTITSKLAIPTSLTYPVLLHSICELHLSPRKIVIATSTSASGPTHPAWAHDSGPVTLAPPARPTEHPTSFPSAPPYTIFIAAGFSENMQISSAPATHDQLEIWTTATRIYARLDTSTVPSILWIAYYDICTYGFMPFTNSNAALGAPITRDGRLTWLPFTNFKQSIWNQRRQWIHPTRQFRVRRGNRGEHRCFTATTTLTQHPDRMVSAHITTWDPDAAGITTCWTTQQSAGFPAEPTQHPVESDEEWEDWQTEASPEEDW